MCWYELNIEPRDVLFFRDAKPMEASSVGAGANWPWPNTLYNALSAAFHTKWPQRQTWEFEHKHFNEKKDKNRDKSSMRFGGLRTVGLFPAIGTEILFAKPADIDNTGKDIAILHPRKGSTNLPDFIKYIPLNSVKPEKISSGEWISAPEMEKYLENTATPLNLTASSSLYDIESRIGIAIDPATGTADKGNKNSDDDNNNESGKIYLAEYMRLRDNVTIKGFASCYSHLRAENKFDVIKEFFNNKKTSVIFGGQRGVATIESIRDESPLPFKNNKYSQTTRIKWILLTPAIFRNGWYPGWIDTDGSVLLPAEKPARKPGETREDWRKRFGKSINAHLVAARTEKALPLSGWDLRSNREKNIKPGPRATRLAVPAGAVYYFEAETAEDAEKLIQTLQGHCMSEYYGEKGFGFGICGSWDIS